MKKVKLCALLLVMLVLPMLLVTGCFGGDNNSGGGGGGSGGGGGGSGGSGGGGTVISDNLTGTWWSTTQGLGTHDFFVFTATTFSFRSRFIGQVNVIPDIIYASGYYEISDNLLLLDVVHQPTGIVIAYYDLDINVARTQIQVSAFDNHKLTSVSASQTFTRG